MVDSDDFNTSAASVEDCKFETKKLAADRARKYRQMLKTTNPEKYEQQLLKNKTRCIEFRKRSRSLDVSDLLKEKQNLRAKKSYEKRKREREDFSKIQVMKTMNRRLRLKGVNIKGDEESRQFVITGQGKRIAKYDVDNVKRKTTKTKNKKFKNKRKFKNLYPKDVRKKRLELGSIRT